VSQFTQNLLVPMTVLATADERNSMQSFFLTFSGDTKGATLYSYYILYLSASVSKDTIDALQMLFIIFIYL